MTSDLVRQLTGTVLPSDTALSRSGSHELARRVERLDIEGELAERQIAVSSC
ncbi:MAG: hypothetical protein H0W56_00240 [Acidothermales bacterium]|nr:hypothetical protein [Acidothermales bacterium]